jgi:single-stranded DNA-binding protein
MKKLLIKIDSYENQNGETKNKYVELGVIKTTQDGNEYALINPTVNLAGCLTQQNMLNHKDGKQVGKNVMCGVFTDQPKQPTQQQQSQQQPQSDEFMDDSIPF